MKYALVIETETPIQTEIVQALNEVDPHLKVEVFSTLATLKDWIALKIDEIAQANHPVINNGKPPELLHEIALVVIKNEMLGRNITSLLRRTREFLIRRKLSTPESPTAFVVTAFEPFKIGRCQDEVISNVIFKPFDKPILLQKLLIALSGAKPAAGKFLYNQQVDTQAEVLKDVSLVRISEYGFTTLTDQKIEVGTIGKYHHKNFNAGPILGLYARCTCCVPEGHRPGYHLCFFTFFGLSQEQLSSVRKLVRSQPKTVQHLSFPHLAPAETKTHHRPHVQKRVSDELDPRTFVTVGLSDREAADIEDLLCRNFKNAKVVRFPSYLHFLLDVNPNSLTANKAKTDGVLKQFKLYYDPDDLCILDPVKGEEYEKTLFGYSTQDIIEKPRFLEKTVEQFDQVRLRGIFDGTIKVPEVLRFNGPDHTLHWFVAKRGEGISEEGEQLHYLELATMSADEKIRFLRSNRKLQGPADGIIFDAKALGDLPAERVKNIEALFKEPGSPQGEHPYAFFVISDMPNLAKVGPSIHETYRPLNVHGLFFKPFDRILMLQTISIVVPGLEDREVREKMSYCDLQLDIRASRFVRVAEISESGLVLKYYRALSVGEFRSFYMASSEVNEIVEILGRCQLTLEADSEGQFSCYFTFFGMTDHFLKYIRNWIHQYYVALKEKEAA